MSRQLLPILQLALASFESTYAVRMSTNNYNKCIDNNPLLLLPCSMLALFTPRNEGSLEGFRSRPTPTKFQSSIQRAHFPLLDLLSVNSGPSELKSNLHLGSAVPSRPKRRNPFRIRTSAKSTRNSFRIRSSKTRHFKWLCLHARHGSWFSRKTGEVQ